jgi:uncharacterized YccA/Bax inhibitor family protein
MATTNPILANLGNVDDSTWIALASSERMTLAGACRKTGLLLFLVAGSMGLSWMADDAYGRDPDRIMPILEAFLLCVPAPFILVWLVRRNRQWSPVAAPAFALLQGVLLGYGSAVYENRYPGIVVQAVFLTVAMCFGLLVAYRFGIVHVTTSLQPKLFAAICGVLLYYLANVALMLLGIRELPMLTSGIPGILVSVAVVVIAGLGLVANFDAAVKSVEVPYPKYMEWYFALGVTVALVWLYLEALALISRSRNTGQQ